MTVQPELNFQAELLRSRSPNATRTRRNDYARKRLGVIRYLRNKWARQ